MTGEGTVIAIFILAAVVVFLLFILCLIASIALLGIRRERKILIREYLLEEMRFRERIKSLKYI